MAKRRWVVVHGRVNPVMVTHGINTEEYLGKEHSHVHTSERATHVCSLTASDVIVLENVLRPGPSREPLLISSENYNAFTTCFFEM